LMGKVACGAAFVGHQFRWRPAKGATFAACVGDISASLTTCEPGLYFETSRMYILASITS
jgi:hypothetical protein